MGLVGKRLFIAVDIDDATRAQVGRISSGLRAAIGANVKASWVPPDRMHVTLHFFGDADDALETRIRRAMADPVRVAPFDVTFDGHGVFPEHGSPRVLWLGIRDGLGSLRRLYAALDPAATGPYTPHLTLARFRPSTRVRDALRALEGRDRPSAGPSRIDRVTLYESRLSPTGPAYVPLAEALLQP